MRSEAESYDEEAKATGWLGPEVAFELAYEYIKQGQSILDIGIGTGLGSIPFRKAGLKVYGMDFSEKMLDACCRKGFADLARHDLTKRPYPYASECLDLSPVFEEIARILRKGGLFVFVVNDRAENEVSEIVVEPEHTTLGVPVTMYRHSARQISAWTTENGFTLCCGVSGSQCIWIARRHEASKPELSW